MNRLIEKISRRRRRKRHVRQRVQGSADRPRLTVFRSHKNIFAQIIDDGAGKTLVSASTLDKVLRGTLGYGGNKSAARVVGAALAERAVESGISQVVFDRNGYAYHGRIKELADAVRKGGLKF